MSQHINIQEATLKEKRIVEDSPTNVVHILMFTSIIVSPRHNVAFSNY
jgi:hypothetical protein